MSVLIVEIIGPTSAGKSTLARKIVARCHQMQKEDAFQPIAIKIGYQKGGNPARIILNDLGWIWLCLRHSGTLTQTATLLRQCIRRKDTLFMRLNLFRNYLRKQGQLISFRHAKQSDQGIIVLDEGPIHATNNVFSHYDQPGAVEQLQKVISAIQAPDFIVRISVDPNLMVKRANSRADPPWKGLDAEQWNNIRISTEKNYDEILSVLKEIPVLHLTSEDIDIDRIATKIRDFARETEKIRKQEIGR